MNVPNLRRRRLDSTPAVLLIAGLAACAGGGGTVDSTAAGPAPVSVGAENIVVAKRDVVENGPAVSGSIVPELSATLRAEIPGAVLEVSAEEGQRVEKGARLARLDDRVLRDAVLSARSGLSSAQNAADVAAREEQREQALISVGAVAERDLDQAKRANIAAQAALADAKARQSSAEEQLRKADILAPFDGVVSDRPVSAGDVVQTGTALFTVVDPSTMRLEASVSAEQVSQVRLGAPVRFTVSGYPEPFTGTITSISPAVDPTTKQVHILARIPNAKRSLVAGLFAEGRVTSESHQGVVVPANAVNERGLSPSVTRVKAGKADPTPVQLGIRDPAREVVEIAAGLSPGDTVLLGVAQGVSAGTPIQIMSTPVDRPAAAP